MGNDLRPHAPPAGTDQVLVVLSDVEMGAGGPADDFPHSDWLADLLLSYDEPPFAGLPVDIVLNGDIVDLFKTPFEGRYPHHVTPRVALGKLEQIAAAHPRFFSAIQELLAHRGAERRVHFVTGNHDAELAFPEIQTDLRRRCGGSERLCFAGFELDLGRVHVEHGSQRDPMFAVDAARPIIEYRGEQLLNLSWGAVTLLDTVMELQPQLAFLDRVMPKTAVFELMPEAKELLTELFWNYWTRDYWRGFFGSDDPARRLTWTMVKEVVWRFGTKEPDVAMDKTLRDRLTHGDDIMLCILGHQHQPAWWSYGDRKLLQAGCLRNEYMLVDEGRELRPIPKCYAEAYLRRGTPLRSHLVEIAGPPAPAGYLPESFFDLLPPVLDLLTATERSRQATPEQREPDADEGEELV
ncbi:MAG: hypothetical protein JXR83_07845 [Deltaproteobacteria bacterium]|nr:hypothetical protein [Deltaproteobacteria bacterium]